MAKKGKKNPLLPRSDENHKHSYRLAFVIVERDYGDQIIEKMKAAGANFTLLLNGDGTARTHLQHLFSIGEIKKHVVLAIVPTAKIAEIIASIQEVYERPGIIFGIKMNAIGGINLLNFLKGDLYGKNV